MRSKWFFLLVATLAAASLWGCGSSGGSGGSAVTPTDTQPQAVGSDSCIVCHGNNVAFVLADWTTSIHNTEGVGCENCHGNGGAHRGIGPIPYPSPSLEGQCAVCHADEASLARHDGDDPATATVVEGYVMRDVESEGCRDCHGDAHDVVAGGINEQWSQSGHAGRIATDAPDTETVWGHYDWDSPSRASCARCHTTTGAVNFLLSPATYSAANNDFSYLAAGQNELLYCWGCHSNVSTGALYTPGAITEVYAGSPTGSPTVTVNYPDAGNSNICMGCHLGREVGGVLAASTGDFSNLSFINSHYLAAGGMIFGEAGYEFSGQDYTGWDSPAKHGRHGDVSRFGDEGPCVTCHMTSADPHKFEVVQKDAAGVITAVSTNACAACHGNMSASWLEERKESFHEALEALNQALLANGIEFKTAYPYFYVAGTTTAFKNWEGVYPGKGKDVMGAAFNYNLLEHDPGAYAHNANYALKLVVDSIDFLADGVIDGNGTFTIDAETVDLLATANAALAYSIEEKHHGGAALVQANYTTDTTVYNVGCGDCHAANPIPDGSRFVTNGLIVDQFAESAHGDVLGEAWMHYDWRSASRASCQRCHTATGFVVRLGDEANTANVFAAADAGLPGEVLRCTGCHTDIASGAVLAAPAFTATYSNGATQAFPNVGVSNLCVRCHGARESGDSIKLSTGDFASLSFINSHYLAAGATVFAAGGYEYDGPSYANPAYYKHDVVGISDPADPAVSDAGPCAACHMGSSANHTWEVVDKNDEGVITAINSEVCVSCHAGDYALTPEDLELEKEEFHAALEALNQALLVKGIEFKPSHPYFYVPGTTTAFKNWEGVYPGKGKDVMGAAFNYNLLEHDPGAYAHNRFYTKRLIFDSIDFLDNGVLDGTINVTGEAAAYLGTTRP